MSFLRAEGCCSGTSTTGTGTLTLAACPAPPGGVDAYQAFRQQGFGTSQTIPIDYTIVEYTDASFATAKQMEVGVGALTIGASVTATTIARTTVQQTATGLNTSTPSYPQGSQTAITIGVAANTLVFISPSASKLMALTPYRQTTVGGGIGVAPMTAGNAVASTGITITTAKDIYFLFLWAVPMLVKRITFSVFAAYTGGTSNVYGRIYAIGSDGRPGKLLYDFGVCGTANSSLSAAANISSGASGIGIFLQPGEYYCNLCPIFSGGSGTPSMYGCNSGQLNDAGSFQSTSAFSGYIQSGRTGAPASTAPVSIGAFTATAGLATAPDPAEVTGWAELASTTSGNTAPYVFFKDS